MFDIACIGILVADVLVKPVEALPQKGLLELVDSIELFSGGNAMTAAINLKKLGLEPAVIGKVGRDPFGAFLTRLLDENGINPAGVAVDERVQTSASVALSNADGERTFLHCVGANGRFCIDDVDWGIIEKSRFVFVTGTYLLGDFDGQQTAEFLKKCKQMGKLTALDVCWDSKGRWETLLTDCYPYIDIFMPSIDEAVELSRLSDPGEIAGYFMARGVAGVVIKLGGKGCYLKENRDAPGVLVAPYKVENVLDTTGAGDSFCSGFLAGLALGKPLYECARLGNAVGALCVGAKGATSGTKNMADTLAFMEECK